MLIHTSKSPNHGQWKPKQRGPLSAVQYAFRRNAERLGIDPDKVKLYFPMWEGAGGLTDICGRYSTATTPGTREGYLGLKFPNISYAPINFGTAQIGLDDEMSVLFTGHPSVYPNSSRLAAKHSGVIYGWTIIYAASGISFVASRVSNSYWIGSGAIPISPFNNSYIFSIGSGKISSSSKDATSSANFTGSIRDSTQPFYLFSDPINTNNKFADQINQFLLSSERFNDSTSDVLFAAPYALLMPVSRPVFFDLGTTPINTYTLKALNGFEGTLKKLNGTPAGILKKYINGGWA